MVQNGRVWPIRLRNIKINVSFFGAKKSERPPKMVFGMFSLLRMEVETCIQCILCTKNEFKRKKYIYMVNSLPKHLNVHTTKWNE